MGIKVTSLAKKMSNEGPAVYYSSAFRDVIEQHLPKLILYNAHDLTVEPNVAHKYRTDFYGLLRYMGVTPQMWWPTLRVNGMTSPTEYTDEMLAVSIPDYNEIERIRSAYTTVHRIS